VPKLLLIVLVLVPVAFAARGAWAAWRFLGLPAPARRPFQVLAVAAVVVAAVAACRYWRLVILAAAVLDGLAFVITAARVALLPSGARRYWPLARWYRLGWKRLACNLWIAYPDQHRNRPESWRPRMTLYPRARFRPDPHGFTVSIRTIPGVGRLELEKSARFMADYWRVARVSVSQPRPGRLLARALVRDPLLEHLGLQRAAAADPARPFRVWLGRDEHGQDRWLDLPNISGVCVGGQPGGGKSQAITSWETQLADKPWAQFANIDGKGAGEFDDFDPRAWITAGDSMEKMLAALEMLTGLMYDRLGCVREFTGGRKNIWSVGVSAEWPLQFSVFDETQSFFDLPAAKALGKEQERMCAQAIRLGSELVRKGRSVGMCSVFSTQKPTSDSLPSAISSNCALSVAFSLKTLDAAKATLGPDIGNYESLSPVALQLPDYCGVAVVSLRDGMAPFVRLRSPMVTEDQAAAAAAASAHLRKDPRATVPVVVPDDASSLAGA
jgi:S-DNA-T family DNA segregation ATPase FtsK/SpoIIIE